MFDADTRATLTALAEAALPAGDLLPAAGAHTVLAAESLVDHFPEALCAALAALLLSFDARALLMHRKRFRELEVSERLAIVEALDAHEATSLLLRALIVPLKVAYFGDARIYAGLGCRYEVDPPKSLERERWRSQVSDAGTLSAGEELDCDVVVVGTGAGGAPMAYELARRGHAVLIVEEGDHHTRANFDGRPLDAMRTMYRSGGLTLALGNTVIPVPVGRGVGGTTLINSGTCFRVPNAVLASWRAAGLRDFTPDALAPHYEAVEAMLGVGPSSAAALGKPAKLIARGCDALGYSHHALRRNAPGCDGQGLCCFGCPTDAKRSTNISYVPAALSHGAQLLTGLRIDEVLTKDGAAVGVRGRSRTGAVTVRAKVVVIACGALMTPVLLLRNGLANRSGELGKNLSIHPATAALGLFDEPVNPTRAVPQGYAIDAFADQGMYFEGASVPPEITAASVAGYGPAFMRTMERFDRSFSFGFMVKDTSRGRVTVGASGSPRISYWLNDVDLAKVKLGFEILAKVFFAAGAREVQLPVRGHTRLGSEADLQALSSSTFAARHVDLTAYHPLGTARMGVAPLGSVVDATHETHDVHHLFIVDGATVPSSLGVNPQLTIMAMALRAAEYVHRRLEILGRIAA